jgi:hypothetical protein
MKSIIRSVLAVLAGVVVAGVVVVAIEAVGHRVYPGPEGHDHEALAAYIRTAPPGVFLFVLAAWGIGTLAGAWLAAWLAGRAPVVHGLIIGGLLLLGALANLLMIPHPVWFSVVGVAMFLPAAWLGAKLVNAGRGAVAAP